VQHPQDAAQDLAVVAPWLATVAVGGQQRLHASEGLVGELEHRACSGLVDLQERDATAQYRHQQPSAAAVLGRVSRVGSGLSQAAAFQDKPGMHRRYGLTDDGWARLAPLLPTMTPRPGGRRR
jgi:hypothetical protein